MSPYLRLTLQQLTYLPDGDLVLITGLYFRCDVGNHLEQGGGRLSLIGLPFRWVPPQGAQVEIWGRLIRGQRLHLQVHDARPLGSPGEVPEFLPLPPVGEELVLTVRVIDVGDCQVALTADGRAYLLTGDELDGRLYCLQGQILTLNPPTLRVIRAIPVLLPAPNVPGVVARC